MADETHRTCTYGSLSELQHLQIMTTNFNVSDVTTLPFDGFYPNRCSQAIPSKRSKSGALCFRYVSSFPPLDFEEEFLLCSTCSLFSLHGTYFLQK